MSVVARCGYQHLRPATQKTEKKDCEFEGSLGYIESTRLATLCPKTPSKHKKQRNASSVFTLAVLHSQPSPICCECLMNSAQQCWKLSSPKNSSSMLNGNYNKTKKQTNSISTSVSYPELGKRMETILRVICERVSSPHSLTLSSFGFRQHET